MILVKTKEFIKKYHMISEGDGVLVGLSGGADSVALLYVLLAIREELALNIVALHIHHGIRKEAQEDVIFCQKLCKKLGVEFYCEYADVPKLSREQGISMEEGGRRARYHLFEEYRQRLGLQSIAVAHHQNDQAETMLFQMFRGSGLRGLAGMQPKRGHIIRPLLAVTRQELEAYLETLQQTFVTDATNLSDDYSRNKIRHHILPVAEEISHGAVERMSQTSLQLQEVLDFMLEQCNEFLEKYGIEEEEGFSLCIAPLRQCRTALQKMILLEAVGKSIETRRDITQKHILAIVELLEKDGEKRLDLPGGWVKKSYEKLFFKKITPKNFQNAEGPQASVFPMEIHPDRIYKLPDGRTVETKLLFNNNLENIPKNDCIKWFDYDKIKSTLSLRNREKGDFLTVRDDGARKSLQDYLVNEKVPKDIRDEILVLADGAHILWVPGKRISAFYKVTDRTKHILQIYIGGQ